MRETYQELEKIKEENPEAGVDFVPAVEYFDIADATSFLAEENGYTEWPDFRILQSPEYPSKHESIQLGVTYRSWVLNAPIYLKWLQHRAEKHGARFIKAELTDLQDAVTLCRGIQHHDHKVDIIAVVASGRGFKDNDSFPSRGQFIIVSNQCDQTISH